MDYTEALPGWIAPGIEPPKSLKDNGWQAGDKPAAAHLNYVLARLNAVAAELQNESASEEWVQEQLSAIEVELTQDYNSKDPDTAISGDAVRRGLETKQNTVRLTDNWLASSVLVNAAPNAQGREYPDGFSFFKVSSSAGAWPTANGYVVTMRAGSGGFQLYFEMYTGNVQTDKTARFWTRSKRDSNAFWQDWSRALTEIDLTTINTELAAVKKSVSDGKVLVRNSITTAKGIVADADGDGIPTHQELATGVGTILARATADAVLDPAFLVVGYSGYDDGIKKNGTLPNLTGVREAQGVGQWPDGGLAVYPERGYQKGGSGDGEIKVLVAQLQSVEGDLIPNNIRNGVNIFGVTGTMPAGYPIAPGNTLLINFYDTAIFSNTSWQTNRKVRIKFSGSYRLSVQFTYVSGYNLPGMRVLKNGAILVPEVYGGQAANGDTRTWDFAFNANDLIEVQNFIQYANGQYGQYRLDNVSLLADMSGVAQKET